MSFLTWLPCGSSIDFWKADEAKDKDGNELFLGREKYAIFRDLGLFLFMYLGDGQNLADTLRLTYDELYYATHGKQLRFLRHKTRERNESASEVIFPGHSRDSRDTQPIWQCPKTWADGIPHHE